MLAQVLLFSSLVQAADYYVVPIDPVQTIRSHEEGGAVKAALASLFGQPDKILVDESLQQTIDAFAEEGIHIRAQALKVEFSQRASCLAEVYRPNPDGSLLGAMMSGYTPIAFELPPGQRWVLHINTDGSLKGWLGDLFGETPVRVLEKFRENGMVAAICRIE